MIRVSTPGMESSGVDSSIPSMNEGGLCSDEHNWETMLIMLSAVKFSSTPSWDGDGDECVAFAAEGQGELMSLSASGLNVEKLSFAWQRPLL